VSEDDEVVQEFVVESYENLDQLTADLVELEQDPTNPEKLSSIFRAMHTIKGTCGFLGFMKLESVAHAGESLLSLLRDGTRLVTPATTTVLLATSDAMRELLTHIEQHGTEGDGDYSVLTAQLVRISESDPSGQDAEVSEIAPEAAAADMEAAEEPELPIAPEFKPTPEATAEVATAPEASEAAVADPVAVVDTADEAAPDDDAEPFHAVDHGAAATIDLDGVMDQESGLKASATESKAPGVADFNIRVDVKLLDTLMNLVGELVLARNQILQYTETQTDVGFIATTQRLNLITTELQGGVMKTRMQPIGNVWANFPRVVRDLSLACEKQVRFEMEGRETELDKTIIEAIKDPLTHLIRNAIDHGLERPADRMDAGKSPEGRLTVRAFHEGGHVNIEIADDGAGIDLDRVREKAVDQRLVSPERIQHMSEREICSLIFLPGFSTAERVTNVSGRGVGMDVVKTNIEKIGGSVDVVSVRGTGTTFRVKIPLTLAIIPALIVTSGGERYAIPQVNLLELVHFDREQLQTSIEMIHGTPTCRLRGTLLPLVELRVELGDEQCQLTSDSDVDAINIVVLQADDRQFGLVVASVNDTEEIVVKPLGQQFKHLTAYAGATIMGDGKVALILDVIGLAQKAGVVSGVRDRGVVDAAENVGSNHDDTQSLLVLHVGDGRRMALPLDLVARLEEFSPDLIERAGDAEVVQYRDDILLLFHLADLIGVRPSRQEGSAMQVVVTRVGDRSIGLVVDEIVDIVEEHVMVQETGSKPGVLGSAVIAGRVTSIVDVNGVAEQMDAALFDSSTLMAVAP
jgi:two-component system chemotaxis sensor kinase CheA